VEVPSLQDAGQKSEMLPEEAVYIAKYWQEKDVVGLEMELMLGP
jgi:hypothetical protein